MVKGVERMSSEKEINYRTEDTSFKNVNLSVSRHRDRSNGCDFCKRDHPTQCFIGFRGDVLWICEKGVKNLINKK